jgi:hypothetical protein
LQALQVFRQPYLKAEHFQLKVGIIQQGFSIPAVLGLNQRFQQIV